MYSSARLIAFSFVSKISSCDSVLDAEWGRFRVGGMRFFLARRDSIEKLRSEFVVDLTQEIQVKIILHSL